MKNIWLLMFLAAAVGTTTAWGINYYRFGHREGFLGPFTMEGSVTAANVMEVISKSVPEGTPQVEVDETSHDFGMMPPGAEGEHVFTVRNTGDDDLRLRLGASTCKCTLGELDNEVVKPGEETQIKLSWTVKEGDLNFSQSAQVITNDPSQVVIQFEIIGKIIDKFDVVPQTWSFGEIATGEPITLSGKVYSFLDYDILPTEQVFSSVDMTDRSSISVEEVEATEEEDGFRVVARQTFKVEMLLDAGIRQGAISQNFMFGFRRLDEDGEIVPPAENDDDPNDYIYVPVKGRIVGPLSMIVSSKLKGEAGGGYIYDLGVLEKDDPHVSKSFVVFKGSHRQNTKLSVGKVIPEGTIKASLGEPTGRGSMTLYPLTIELIRGDEPVARRGKNKEDYGLVWIESDNPLVSKMRIAVKFAIEAR